MNSTISSLTTLALGQLRPGSVIFRHCHFTTPPKKKYMVVASTEPRLLVLMINSKISNFHKKQGMDDHYVTVPVRDHDFLRYDSYACCVDAHSAFDLSDIQDALLADYKNTFQGWLTDDCLKEIYHAVKNNEVMRTGQQREILNAIEARHPELTEPCDA